MLVYEGDSDDCGLQTAPIEQIWVPDLHVYETVNQCVRERGIPGGVGLAF